jgi:hypothetical protein
MSSNQFAPIAALEPREALVAIVLAAARADGSVLPCEAERLEHTLSSLVVFRGQPVETSRGMLEKVAHMLHGANGTSVLREAASVLPGRLKGATFAIAVDVLLADGRLRGSDLRFLQQLRRRLRVRRSVADRAVRVLRTKNCVWTNYSPLAWPA